MSDLIEAAPAELPQPTDLIGNQAFIWAYEELRKRHANEFIQLVQERHWALSLPARKVELDIDGQRFERMLVLTSQICRVSIEEIVGRSRMRSVTRARFVAAWGAREFTAMSYPVIAERFERDHTTIVNAVQRVTELLAAGDPTYTRLTRELSSAMRTEMAVAA